MKKELPYRDIRNIIDGAVSIALENIEYKSMRTKHWKKFKHAVLRVDRRDQIVNEALDRVVFVIQPPKKKSVCTK